MHPAGCEKLEPEHKIEGKGLFIRMGTPRGNPPWDSPGGLPYKEVGMLFVWLTDVNQGFWSRLNVFNQEPITPLPWAPGSTQKATILSRQSIFTGALKEIIIKNAVISLLIGIF